MLKLRMTYDEGARLFFGTIHMQNRKIVWDSVRKLAYDIPVVVSHYRKSILRQT